MDVRQKHRGEKQMHPREKLGRKDLQKLGIVSSVLYVFSFGTIDEE
jgi:hypothetical protein